MDLLEKSNSNKRHPWELARFKVVKSMVDMHFNNYAGKKILDLGCGDLYFLEQFAKDKPETEFYAVDIAFEENLIHSKMNKLIHSYRSLEDLPENLTFDIVFLMDVIEHVEDDLAFLKNLMSSPFINNETLIVITAPAYQLLFCHYDRFLNHYRRYTNTTLNGLAAGAGLKIIDKGYFFFSLLLPRSVETLRDRMSGRKSAVKGTRLTTWSGQRMVTQALEKILYLDYRIHYFLKKMGFASPGLSNYLLCKKRVS